MRCKTCNREFNPGDTILTERPVPELTIGPMRQLESFDPEQPLPKGTVAHCFNPRSFECQPDFSARGRKPTPPSREFTWGNLARAITERLQKKTRN